MKREKYIVWDWNGTLLDDVPVCVQVMDEMLARRGLPGLGGVEGYREIFTFPVRDYYQAAGWDFRREPFEKLAVEYIAEYNRRALSCGLYPGAREVLKKLSAAGFYQLIASASERSALREQVESCGIGPYFQALLGVGDSLGTSKEGLARDWLAAKGISPRDVLFIGDTLHDWETAQRLGCRCLLVAGGHQSRKRLETTGAKVWKNLTEAAAELLQGPACPHART